MTKPSSDDFSKEAVLARLRAGKRGSDRNKVLVWVLDGLALFALFLPGYWLWIALFLAARFARAAPTPLGWITLGLLSLIVFAQFVWRIPTSPPYFLTGHP